MAGKINTLWGFGASWNEDQIASGLEHGGTLYRIINSMDILRLALTWSISHPENIADESTAEIE